MSLIETSDHAVGTTGDTIRELRLARAPVNALNPQLCGELEAAIAAAVADGAQGLVLSGGPTVFSAGLDVPWLLSLGDDRTALLAAWQQFFTVARSLASAPVPVVAAIAGHAPAGGCVLALCCDYRVMARSPGLNKGAPGKGDPDKPFLIGLNETRVGLVAPEGIAQLLRRVVGPYRAERLLVSGEMVDSERALAIGLVDELVDVDETVARARAWLGDLLTLPRQPMLETRKIARSDLLAALQPERIDLDRFIDAWSAPDTQAGLHALVAKLGK